MAETEQEVQLNDVPHGPFSALFDLAMMLGHGHGALREWRLEVVLGEGERHSFRWDQDRRAVLREIRRERAE